MNEYKDFVTALRRPADEYGEVPFYWWNGEALDKERITAQLEALAAKGVAGVQVNYMHRFGGGEEDAAYGGAGLSLPGDPVQFSEAWWAFFRHAAAECRRLGMGIGVGDYTLAWIGNGYFTDRVAADPAFAAAELSAERRMLFGPAELQSAEDLYAVVVYDDPACEKPRILWQRDGERDFPLGCYDAFLLRLTPKKQAFDPMSPGCGERLVDIYFSEFERRLPEFRGTLNYFFQDELLFGADVHKLWREELRERVKKEKGYDPLGFLPHLFFKLGRITAKIRLDIADCRTALMEEHYFRPVYEFHSERGMIYGCDQSGRGRDPGEFSDYFRAVRWFTAPGNDTPGRAADLIKVKVNASIAGLYERPRVWLEGYHSSGWGTSPADITAATSDHFLFGANLLNLHGLYYTTLGGFFEWAPPDFHFRMPYWDDMESWLKKYKRLSCLLTTGAHMCDAAIFYPVSSFDYGEDAARCRDATFETAGFLFERGMDFDFIDHQSILNAAIEDGELKIAGCSYRAVILCAVDCVRFSVIEKLAEFAREGGGVIFTERTPFETDLPPQEYGRLSALTEEILSCPGGALVTGNASLLRQIGSGVRRSFLPDADDLGEKKYCTARRLGEDRLFFLRYCARDSVCRFEATGQPFLLNSETGRVTRLLGTVQTQGFTFVKLPNEPDADTLILFTDDYVPFDDELDTAGFEGRLPVRGMSLGGEWSFLPEPTLDNAYGDFYLPAGGVIGPEARFFACAPGEETPEKNAPYLPYGRSLAVWVLKNAENVFALARAAAPNGSELPEGSEPLALSDRWGYIHPEANTLPAMLEQGHHGLRGRVWDHNMIFDGDALFATDVLCAEPTPAWLKLTGVEPDVLYVNGAKITDPEAMLLLPAGRIRLVAGFVYDETKRPDYINRAPLKRAGVWLTREKDPAPLSRPLTRDAYRNPAYLPFAPANETARRFTYRFQGFPGAYGFEIPLLGAPVHAEMNGRDIPLTRVGDGYFGGGVWRAEGSPAEGTPVFTLTVDTEPGASFTGAIPEPARLLYGEGKIEAGDTAKVGALASYSGKLRYRRTVTLKKRENERFMLDLGSVKVTANVNVNGETAAVLTHPPYVCDITAWLKDGDNELTVTVSNTLCNHYSTIPSPYANYPRDAASGLIGPVSIDVFRTE